MHRWQRPESKVSTTTRPPAADRTSRGPRRIMARRRSWKDARCLVTGASSGLGRAMAEHLLAAGARVVLTGRSAERLEVVARRHVATGADPQSALTIAGELTNPEARKRIVDFAAQH